LDKRPGERRSRSKKKQGRGQKKGKVSWSLEKYSGPRGYASVDITISDNENTYRDNDSKCYDPIFIDEGSSGNQFDNSGIISPKENIFGFQINPIGFDKMNILELH
jgi:hypothetical protein